MTKDFGYALLDVSVGLNEEPDKVIPVIREVTRAMRTEPRWESALRDDLEVMGIEKFIDLAWVLRIRIKTLPGQRWAVSRELNKRIKMAFDEQAIDSPITSHIALSTIPGPPPEPDAAPSPAQPAEKPAAVEAH
jgi:small conductance mechanosensitive channel